MNQTNLVCPRCKEGRFPYSRGKNDSSGAVTVRIRKCPLCGLVREDTHHTVYRESEAIQTQNHFGEPQENTSLPN